MTTETTIGDLPFADFTANLLDLCQGNPVQISIEMLDTELLVSLPEMLDDLLSKDHERIIETLAEGLYRPEGAAEQFVRIIPEAIVAGDYMDDFIECDRAVLVIPSVTMIPPMENFKLLLDGMARANHPARRPALDVWIHEDGEGLVQMELTRVFCPTDLPNDLDCEDAELSQALLSGVMSHPEDDAPDAPRKTPMSAEDLRDHCCEFYQTQDAAHSAVVISKIWRDQPEDRQLTRHVRSVMICS